MISELIYQLPIQDLKRKGDKFHFKCNVCGDSATSIKKKRAWILQYKGHWIFKCHNCGVSYNFYNYLKIYFPDIYVSSLKNKLSNKKEEYKEIIKKEIQLYTEFPLISIDRLDKNHKAYLYLLNRKIPLKSFDRCFYSSDFTKFTNKMTNDRYHDWKFHEERIVLPYYARNKKVFAFQGRSLEEDAFLRYLTVKLDDDSDKIYGLDRIDYSKPIFILEGVFDSFFVDNSICMGGSDLSEEILKKYFNKNQIIFIFDMEPRNKEINFKIEQWLKLGYKIVLFPKYLKQFGKDLNDWVKNGLTIEEINSIIHDNIVYGKEGLLKFKIWRIR